MVSLTSFGNKAVNDAWLNASVSNIHSYCQTHKLTHADHNFQASTQPIITNKHLAVVDTGNSVHPCFKSMLFFLRGVQFHDVLMHGVHGSHKIKIGVGTAFYKTVSTDGNFQFWIEPDSFFKPDCPMNLLCSDRFHFKYSSQQDTGHEFFPKREHLKLSNGSEVKVVRDPATKLPLMTVYTFKPKEFSMVRQSRSNLKNTIFLSTILSHNSTNTNIEPSSLNMQSFYSNVHLQPLTVANLHKMLHHPMHERFNKTLEHNMIAGLPKAIGRLRTQHRAEYNDAYWSGKATQRHVPSASRSGSTIELDNGTHITSDIGVVPIKDYDGNKYFVFFKCKCTQFIIVYKMKHKSDLINVYRDFIRLNRLTTKKGKILIHNKLMWLVTDADRMYVKGEVERVNREKLIGRFTLGPYSPQQNPGENTMRRLMEGAVQLLHSSGLEPCFLLDALITVAHHTNAMFTPIHHKPEHKLMSPHHRWYLRKPHISEFPPFGCKTIVCKNKLEKPKRKHGDSHVWIGMYVGPVHNSLNVRVYRYVSDAVSILERYHVMFDCSVLYGDFLGEMWEKRVKADMLHRKLYNTQIDVLMGLETAGENDSADVCLQILKSQNWQKLPTDTTSDKETGIVTNNSKTNSNRVRKSNSNVTRKRKRRVTIEEVDDENEYERAEMSDEHEDEMYLPNPPTPATHTTRQQLLVTPSHTPQIQPTQPVQHETVTPTNLPARVQAARDSLQMLPVDNAKSLLLAIDHSAHYVMTVSEYLLNDYDGDLTNTCDLMFASEAQSYEEFCMLQLCEQTRKEIAQRTEPSTKSEIAQRLAQKDTEAALISEAMLDEVMYSNVPTDMPHALQGHAGARYNQFNK